MEIRQIKHNSENYWTLVNLRDQILRKPLNLSFTKEELLAENNQFHFAVFVGNEIVAGLILVKSDNKSIKMRQVCVSGANQGQGIGYELAKYAEEWAKEKGYTLMYCNARQNALEFYTKQGYSIKGESFKEVGLEHFRLVKAL